MTRSAQQSWVCAGQREKPRTTPDLDSCLHLGRNSPPRLENVSDTNNFAQTCPLLFEIWVNRFMVALNAQDSIERLVTY